MIPGGRDGQGGRFNNWHAMTAVLEATRQTPGLPYFRLQMELAARVDPTTGTTRASLRELATALHHRYTRTTRNQLLTLEAAGWWTREGTGRRGHASDHNTETYRPRDAVRAPPTEPSRRREGASRGAVRATDRGAVRATDRDRDRSEGAASPAPSRSRSGSPAPEAGNGRVQVNDRSWRDHGPPTGGPPEHIRAELEAFKAKNRPGTVHQLHEPGQEAPPAHEGSTGTWG